MPSPATTAGGFEQLDEIFHPRGIAVVGVSATAGGFGGNMFLQALHKQGFAGGIYAVNPRATEIDGLPCYKSVREIDPPVDAALVMTQPKFSGQVARECVEAGVKRVWLYKAAGDGAVSDEAVKICQENGVDFVPGRCPFMFLPNPGVHALHGVFLKLFGMYPK